jgi:hypothetical protein
MAMLRNTFRMWRMAAITPITIVLLLLTLNIRANALIINPGGNLATTGAGAFSGTLIYDTGALPFTGKDVTNTTVFTGTLDAQVYRESDNYLDFVYQFTNDASSADSIGRLTISGYSGVTANADYVTTPSLYPSGLQLAPDLMNRQSAQNGDAIGFSFDNDGAPYFSVFPGFASTPVVIDTNVTTYAFDGAFLQDGGNAQLIVPTPVPEPVSASLLGFGFSVLALRRRVRTAR